jgi:hypothetical protein
MFDVQLYERSFELQWKKVFCFFFSKKKRLLACCGAGLGWAGLGWAEA